jgi:hypothetical protein
MWLHVPRPSASKEWHVQLQLPVRKKDVVHIVLTAEPDVQGLHLDSFRFRSIAACLLDLPDEARIHDPSPFRSVPSRLTDHEHAGHQASFPVPSTALRLADHRAFRGPRLPAQGFLARL